LKAYKEHKYLTFEFENGKTVKYDLATGETIGKHGKPVKSLQSQLSGYNIHEVISSFEDENYRKYLRFVLRHFINDCRNDKKRYKTEVNRVSNIGTFLQRIGNTSYFEQYFAAGIDTIDPGITKKLSEIPKQLIQLVKKYQIKLDTNMLDTYNNNPEEFKAVIELECNSLTLAQKYDLLNIEHRRWELTNSGRIRILRTTYEYNLIPLVKYIDHLMTYEALNLPDILQELTDYCRMMSRISQKYDKYPRNFLTSHKIATRNYNRLCTTFSETAFVNCIEPAMEWNIDGFSMIYPQSTEEIKDEAAQQNNCVASYIDRVIAGDCHIIFLRHTKTKERSLITLEVKNNKVVQAKGRFNREPTAEEHKIINKYNAHLLWIKNHQTTLETMFKIETPEMIVC